ncbi:NAD(P)-dependent oxidoreductase [Sphaerisporangium melleum]|uniref:NAD(P)-dependent oxidoreductase n=1 Tax=Sphaerisporangium melleum TaxID=321316 RepID=A0A917RFK0_9ACTN|nr:SDR family oxidoreductase [Sphaerisporangium melleum]GGL05643.1 NAD(P)-dependent oxidoreductase [Sphaerisporangium melleum]GII73180.1 NAD(P)-dependent oxidoreductase [Sphaerisporangium melleum]
MIVVTGATGQLGRLVVQGLLERLPAGEIVAAVRNPGKAADLAGRGVRVREVDYDRPETLKDAFGAGDVVLLISADEVGSRVPQHTAVVDAAAAAGVARISYTSVLHADVSTTPVAPDHRATEKHIAASGLPYTFLRNGWYTENYEAAITQGAAQGTIYGSAGEGRVASATRADYAAAAVAVLTGEGHENKVYELSGDAAWTMADLAAEVAAAAGRQVAYQDLPLEAYEQALVNAGLPAGAAAVIAGCDAAVAGGELADTPGDLRALIGRPATPLRDTVAAVLGKS